MWWADLPAALLWRPPDYSFLQRNLDLPNVPSWSWASRKGPLIFQISSPGSAGQGPPFPEVSSICTIHNSVTGTALRVLSRLKSLDGISVQRPRDEETLVDASEETREIIQRTGPEALVTVSRKEEIGSAHFDEGVYGDSPHLHRATCFLPLVQGMGDEDGKSWCEGLLLQRSTSVTDAFERVGVAQVTEMAWLNDVVEQSVCIV